MAKIAIDAGHGLSTPGKRCMKSLDPNQTREWVLNDRVADGLEVYLKSAGHQTLRVDDITGKKDISLDNRVKAANDWGADYYISAHHNAGIKGGKGGGTVVIIYPGTSGKTKETQKAIYENAIKEAGLKGNRSNPLTTSNLQVLRETNMPAALIECGFMDSATDIEYILDPQWSKKIALGIAKGICEVYGGTVKEVQTQAPSVKDNNTVDYAESFSKSYAKTWTTTDKLNMRAGANTSKALITTVKKGTKVQCYGYYTKESDGTVWLLCKHGNKTGFMSKGYLK